MKAIFRLLVWTFFILIQFGCQMKNENRNFELEGDWYFRNSENTEWFRASVPGCVHTDLLENKIIPDPFYRENEKEVQWVEEADWEYKTSFTVPVELESFSNIDLHFEGLDTYADVYLNDSLILTADNMFLARTVPVRSYLKNGENILRIYFRSAVNAGMEKLRKVPYTLVANNELAPEDMRTNVFTRKAPFHYGWDWGPRLVTCGIWKPIRIEAWNDIKMQDLYIKPVNIDSQRASYNATAELVSAKRLTAELEVWVDNKPCSNAEIKIEEGTSQVEIAFAIDKPEFWWTNGLGNQKLYEVELHMREGNKKIQSISTKIGVRTIELVQQKDSIGNSFEFRLNNVPVFMKGANYIPSDIFTTRNTVKNYRRVIADAVNANMNMLRIWGGAIYESDEFYDMLDENGILAWNDFMFACNIQPDDSLHLLNIKKEAEYNVKRLRNHPSVALWCGNNENLRGWHDWGWRDLYSEEVTESLWGVYEKIFYRILPDAVKKYHPEIDYWPSSPQSIDNKPADRLSGDEHDWTVWFMDTPYSSYSQEVGRFISEYGMQSFPEMKTIRAFAEESDYSYRSPVMEHRQRSQMPWIAPEFNGNEMSKTYIDRYYNSPVNFESFVYLSQLVQAEGIKYAIESHRRNMPHCMGTLYWQINDCWPAISWSGVDYYGRWKAMHYFVKKAFQNVYPIIYEEDGNLIVSVANDNLQAEEITIELKLYDFSGKVLWNENIGTQLFANTSHKYLSIPLEELLSKGSRSQMVFETVLKAGNEVISGNLYYFVDCKKLQLAEASLKKDISKVGENEYEVILSTDYLVKNVALYSSNSEGSFSDNFFDMIPGKKYKIRYTGKADNLEESLYLMSVYETYHN